MKSRCAEVEESYAEVVEIFFDGKLRFLNDFDWDYVLGWV